MVYEVSSLVTLKYRLGREAMMSRLGLEAMMSRLNLGRFGPRSSLEITVMTLLKYNMSCLEIYIINHQRPLSDDFSENTYIIKFFDNIVRTID